MPMCHYKVTATGFGTVEVDAERNDLAARKAVAELRPDETVREILEAESSYMGAHDFIVKTVDENGRVWRTRVTCQFQYCAERVMESRASARNMGAALKASNDRVQRRVEQALREC